LGIVSIGFDVTDKQLAAVCVLQIHGNAVRSTAVCGCKKVYDSAMWEVFCERLMGFVIPVKLLMSVKCAEGKPRRADMCLIHVTFRMVWRRYCIASYFQRLLQNSYYEAPSFPGGTNIEWGTLASGPCWWFRYIGWKCKPRNLVKVW